MYILGLLQNPVDMAVFLLALVLSVTVHEFAHAWAAVRLGDETPRLMGRETLDPRAHLDPMGSVLFLLVGFGWGKPVLYNPHRLSYRYQELLVALAGPISNLLLALAFNILAFLAMQEIVPIAPSILTLVATLNVALAAFNLLPIPPLDGSSIVAYFWPEYRSVLGTQIGFILLIILLWFPILPGRTVADIFIAPLMQLFTHVTKLFGLL